ncbi:hypothetical protein HOP50_13g70120 [Chloropicon primus]|nr:hypothetical protein HOP50_13g70120 [Chloropicon primus]
MHTRRSLFCLTAALLVSLASAGGVLEGLHVEAGVRANLAQALDEFESELQNANAEMFRELSSSSSDFAHLNETAHDLEQVFFSRNVDVPIEMEDASPEMKRVLASLGRPGAAGSAIMGWLGKFIPTEYQAPTYRPIKMLRFYKRYSFSASCALYVKVYGDTPTGSQLFTLSCGKPRLRQSFVYQWQITIPIGPLRFDFELPIGLPDISGFESILKIANGDFNGVLELVGLG